MPHKSRPPDAISKPSYRLLKSTTPVLQCSHARSASTVVTRPWTRYARRDFARKMGFSGPNGPHRKPPLRGGMLRMSWRYAPWSTRLAGFQQPGEMWAQTGGTLLESVKPQAPTTRHRSK